MADNTVIICGAGGHAKSVLGVLEAQGRWQVAGLLDDDPRLLGARVLGYEVIGGRERLPGLRAAGIARGMVAIGDNARRGALARDMTAAGFTLIDVIHPSASVMKNAIIGPGAFIHAHTVIGADAVIGDNAIVSACSNIGHDSVVGNCVHLTPGVRIGGNVRIGDNSFLGMGAVVLPGISIGRQVTVTANAVVTKDIGDNTIAAGMPARAIRTHPSPER